MGLIYHRPIIKYPSYDVVRVEYFFDDDPGLGNGVEIPVTPSETVIIDEELLVSTLSSGTHTLNVRAMSEQNFWSDIYTATFSIFATGIDDPSGKEYIKVYPNPTRGIVNLELNRIDGLLHVQVVALNGSVVLLKDISCSADATLDLRKHPNGMYVVIFSDKDQEMTQNIFLAKALKNLQTPN